MNRNRLVIGFAFALLLAFAASAFVYHAFQKAAAAPAAVVTKHIVVAAEALPLGTLLDASKLRTIAWPASEPVAGMFTSVEDVANRAVITSLAENEPILEAKLAPREAGAGLSATIPAGMRAISVAVNDVIGVAGFVTPGTTVDVLVTGSLQGSMGTPTTVTRTILENVRVLAAGQKMQQDREGKPETVPVITLLVAPDDAGKLAMASTEGKIQLALRNTVDIKATSPAPVLESSLFASGEAPAPVEHAVTVARKVVAPPPPPPAPFTIEVISGGKRETKSFPNQ
jgi:pilus assembly protein CpaB